MEYYVCCANGFIVYFHGSIFWKTAVYHSVAVAARSSIIIEYKGNIYDSDTNKVNLKWLAKDFVRKDYL